MTNQNYRYHLICLYFFKEEENRRKNLRERARRLLAEVKQGNINNADWLSSNLNPTSSEFPTGASNLSDTKTNNTSLIANNG